MKPLVTTYSPQQCADMLGLPKSTILGAIERDELPAIRFNKRVLRITAVDCASWYASKGGRLKTTTPTTAASPQAP